MLQMASFAFIVKPNQAKLLSFPKHSFGKKNVMQRAFKPSWFYKWKWIHYDETINAAFCLLLQALSSANFFIKIVCALHAHTYPVQNHSYAPDMDVFSLGFDDE